MRAIIKFPLLTLLCLLSAEASFIRPAAAGSAPVVLPESGSSGLGDTFSPAARPTQGDASQILSNRIYSGITDMLRTLQQRESVPSVGGQILPISSEQLAQIETSFLGREGGTGFRLTELEQQLASDLGGKVIEVSLLGNSSGDLAAAIESTNALIMSLDSEQLVAATKSPTFMALLRLLNSGNDVLSDRDLDRLFEAGDREFGILQMSLADDRATEPNMPPAAPVVNEPQSLP